MNFLSIFLTMRENIEIFFAIQQRHATTKKVFFTKSRHPQSGCFCYNIYTHITYSITLKVYEKAPPHSAHRAAAAAAKATLTAQANNTHAYVVIVALFQSRGSVEYQHVMCKLLWMKNLFTQGPLIQPTTFICHRQR